MIMNLKWALAKARQSYYTFHSKFIFLLSKPTYNSLPFLNLEYSPFRGFTDGAVVTNPPANARDARDVSLIPELGRFSTVGDGKRLQYSCLENSMHRGAWWATVHGIKKRQTQMNTHTHTHTHTHIHTQTHTPFIPHFIPVNIASLFYPFQKKILKVLAYIWSPHSFTTEVMI